MFFLTHSNRYLNSDGQGCSSVLLKLETPILPLKCMRMRRQMDIEATPLTAGGI